PLLALGPVPAQALGGGPAQAPAAPDVPVGVAADPVGEPGLEVGEDLAVPQGVARDVEHDDVGGILRPVGRSGVHDVAFLEVGREADAVRASHRAFGRDGRLAAGIDAIHRVGSSNSALCPSYGPRMT